MQVWIDRVTFQLCCEKNEEVPEQIERTGL